MATTYPQVVLFDDTIIREAAGTWDDISLHSAPQIHCTRRFDMINRGLGSYHTSQALHTLPDFSPLSSIAKLEYLVILFGANDAALPQQVDNQYVPLDEYERNQTNIFTHPYIQAHSPNIVLVKLPPLNGICLSQFELLADVNSTTSRQARIVAQRAGPARPVAKVVLGVAPVDLLKSLMDHVVRQTSE